METNEQHRQRALQQMNEKTGTRDVRQDSIIYQNQSNIALRLLIHNSKGEPIDPKDVVKLTLKLMKIALNPMKYDKGENL